MSQIADLSAESFEREVLQAEVPVLVDFGATWCPPCRRIGPEVEAVAQQMGDRARVRMVDVDAEPDLAARYGVQGIPALFVFKGGKVVEQMTGFRPRGELAERVKAHL